MGTTERWPRMLILNSKAEVEADERTKKRLLNGRDNYRRRKFRSSPPSPSGPLAVLRRRAGVPSQELWCVAKNNAEDASLQAALDWACGAGGADCGPIQAGDPATTPTACRIRRRHDNCKFPSGVTGSSGSFSGSTPSSSVGLGPSEDLSGCMREVKLKIALDLMRGMAKENVFLVHVAQTDDPVLMEAKQEVMVQNVGVITEDEKVVAIEEEINDTEALVINIATQVSNGVVTLYNTAAIVDPD
ncbi:PLASMODESMATA CALLOSE-BINDING PROTEIN 5 [Spatholobus suberectus]|nr:PLASMODESMATA CALLOSE-BINDING PROTEIN 5 [Spatholobus suberectus]